MIITHYDKKITNMIFGSLFFIIIVQNLFVVKYFEKQSQSRGSHNVSLLYMNNLFLDGQEGGDYVKRCIPVSLQRIPYSEAFPLWELHYRLLCEG